MTLEYDRSPGTRTHEDARVQRLSPLDRARFQGASTYWVEVIGEAAPGGRSQRVLALARALAWQEVARGRQMRDALDEVQSRCREPGKLGLVRLARRAFEGAERQGEEFEALMSSMG